MEMVRIGLIGIIGVLLAVGLRSHKAEYGVYIAIAVCLVILSYTTRYFTLILSGIEQMRGYLYDNYKESRKTFNKEFKNLVILFIPLFIISIVFIGYSTYITNFIDHNNPFFPVYGEDKEDIITAQEPKEFLKYNNAEKVFYATFSKVNNLMENKIEKGTKLIYKV